MTNALVKTISVCLADLLFQLECADEEQVNSDFAVALMETVSAELQGLEGAEAAEFVSAIREMASAETDKARKDYLEAFAENFGLIS